jgi:hypothetical protein
MKNFFNKEKLVVIIRNMVCMKADKAKRPHQLFLKKKSKNKICPLFIIEKVFYLFSAGNLCVLEEKQEMQIKLKGSSWCQI